MRTPVRFGDLLPVAVPGFLVVGAASLLVMQTAVGVMIFNGPIVFLLLGLLVGVLVLGYILAGVQEILSTRLAGWSLPPEAHLDDDEHVIEVPAYGFERAGFSVEGSLVQVPLGSAFALERALAGAWGTPEGAGWERIAFLQRVTLGFIVATLIAVLFFVGGIAQGQLDAGVRSHGGMVFLLGALGTWLVGRRIRPTRQEAVLDLFADARALLLDRGEQDEVRRVMEDLGLSLAEEDPGLGVSP